MIEHITRDKTTCYHCGEACTTKPIIADDKVFCCEGCKMVYGILHESGLCGYYTIADKPGINQKMPVRKDKFAFLDDATIGSQLISFANESQTHVTFYLPQIHCASCLWLLENLHRVNPHIVSSKVNFGKKEVDIIFNHHAVSLRTIAETLTSIGYEPYISLGDAKKAKPAFSKSRIYKVGIAGFAFVNIMLLSFPDYLGIGASDGKLVELFRLLALILSLPVVFYSATEFYSSAWKSLQHRFLNIDAPIVLAIWVTFGRSLYEVITATGNGYFDSLSGIVFFMLVGRMLQDKTYEQLNFDRDYSSYFPIAVTRIAGDQSAAVSLENIRLNDTLLIHSEELIPADGILTRGRALIDYSFVTGETVPVRKEMGEIIYAGGKQIGSAIEMLVIKEVTQSYLTKLWNRDEFKKDNNASEKSFVHVLSRYFTWIVFAVALSAAAYWFVHNPARIWPSVTAVLIIACPCALLLSNTFTNGNMLRILSRNKCYLRNAQTIENMAAISHIVFDKTGTLTEGNSLRVQYSGTKLTPHQEEMIGAVAAQSNHPLSRSIAGHFNPSQPLEIKDFIEFPGLGLEAKVDNKTILLGSRKFIDGTMTVGDETAVYISIDGVLLGKCSFRNQYRQQVEQLITRLRSQYGISILSGDNDGERQYLQQLVGPENELAFFQQPVDKLTAISKLQQQGKKVMMIGDGLNDAGALKQADVGMAVSDQGNNFTPASDAIIDAEKLTSLLRFIRLCKSNKRIVMASFVVSILYNIIGIFFSVQGTLSPMIAAILMPASSISILLITFGASNMAAKRLKL